MFYGEGSILAVASIFRFRAPLSIVYSSSALYKWAYFDAVIKKFQFHSFWAIYFYDLIWFIFLSGQSFRLGYVFLKIEIKTWWKLVYVCFVRKRRNYLIRLFIIMHQTYEEKNVRKHLANASLILHSIGISLDLIFDAESSRCYTIYNQCWSPFFIYFIFDSEIFCQLFMYQIGYLM